MVGRHQEYRVRTGVLCHLRVKDRFLASLGRHTADDLDFATDFLGANPGDTRAFLGKQRHDFAGMTVRDNSHDAGDRGKFTDVLPQSRLVDLLVFVEWTESRCEHSGPRVVKYVGCVHDGPGFWRARLESAVG